MALNTYPQAANPGLGNRQYGQGCRFGVDAIILADPGLMQYASSTIPAAFASVGAGIGLQL